MTPWTEQQFLTEAHLGAGDEHDLEEALGEFLRSHGFHDVAKQCDGMVEEARWAGWAAGKEQASDDARSDLEHFCGKLRSALGRGDVDAAKTLIDLQLGQDEEGHQLAIEEEAQIEE